MNAALRDSGINGCRVSQQPQYIAVRYTSKRMRDDNLDRLSRIEFEVPLKVAKFRVDKTGNPTSTTNFLVHAGLVDTAQDVQAAINAELRARGSRIPQYSIRKVYHVAFESDPRFGRMTIPVGSASAERAFVQETRSCSVCANHGHNAIVCGETGVP